MSSEEQAGGVTDNAGRQRFELQVEGQLAFADYLKRGDTLVITHVETPSALRGGGVAGRVMQGVLESARAQGLKVDPVCPYAEVYIRRHPEYQDLLG